MWGVLSIITKNLIIAIPSSMLLGFLFGMGEGGDFIAHERRVATYVRDALRQ